MKEYIVPLSEEEAFYGYKDMTTELIRCRDCKWWKAEKKECVEWYDSPYAPADGYCFRAERKEE